jgi:hypothetical protein
MGRLVRRNNSYFFPRDTWDVQAAFFLFRHFFARRHEAQERLGMLKSADVADGQMAWIRGRG